MDTLRNVLTHLERKVAALAHFNVADLVLLKAVIAAADGVKVPVLVGAFEGERNFFGTCQLAAVVKKPARRIRSAHFFERRPYTFTDEVSRGGKCRL